MPKIRVTKIFRFEMAHALLGYDGLCKNMHGHSYIMNVTVSGEPITDQEDIKEGMVIDFGDLKRVVKEYIVDVYDHSVVLNKKAPVEQLLLLDEMFDRHHFTSFQPTAENMVIYFAELLNRELPNTVKLESIVLYETANSYAEWLAADNQ
ncbi:MAG: 6-carboxytetrahydropterin synthase [Bacteroidetes bacterium]|jgi:6-pyruvoyltetrahydropterin/6-carboxytetrahydropterin synthase|nr:6-carboxytetrahydropterin synthase [Bacteroidota bacterium]MBT3747689.1 6-carboxytetrahydropterin synthase [Bacteroidota bacterium]MBT4398389.1 6-carboxytetrahydropterin synthase [Bacteroidota bacterium]MBT4412087.1 6-carboxytetrahydropterin synthase [Bacteroidota bacterium]MBT5427511.1 6-carboxytetrahydropterin synthase [Bacteroidota bacterium]